MSAHLDKRLRPDLLVPGARSVICLAVGYAPRDEPAPGIIARYARGKDYHDVLRARCKALMKRIGKAAPDFRGRAFVDSAPIMERTLAASAGVGWIGRNGCLIVPNLGSYVVLCEIVCNLPLTPDAPVPDGCADCRACVAACPTGAIQEGGLIDARGCVSYLTIEHRGDIEQEHWPRMGCRVFGCDACQEACPRNRELPAGAAELLGQAAPLGGAGLADILRWTEREWDAATRGSAVRRAKLPTLLRNAVIAAGNSGDPSLAPPLSELALRLPELAKIVRWALDRLRRA
jgi:epoxyqueuosine reductase